MIQKELRSYEISIWSLQDDYITVLKQADIEYKGQAQDAEMRLNVDGTQELTFRLPMYIYNDEGVKVENPVWYNYINGITISSMRKIKVIINKSSENEEIHEFIIVKVTESHEKGELYCEINCEGLAFHELGKIGYKISLTSEDFYAADLNYFKTGIWTDARGIRHTETPIANLQYWMNQFMSMVPNLSYIDPHTWYYDIQMDWSSYTRYNGSTNLSERDSGKIYEEEYVPSWNSSINSDTLRPARIEGYKEKERMVDLEESNIYNLTQDLAETFGVYCKYVYEHDNNYHISGRRIIFYNNFIEEDKGVIDITYKYNTASITREMDGTDLVTKMYVRPVDSDTSASGLISIMDVGANKSREDYLLNFDYLYSIGAISDDAYKEIPKYEKKMHDLNLKIVPIQERLVELQAKKPEAEAQIKILNDSIQLSRERISDAQDLLNNLTNESGRIDITETNPKYGIMLKDTNNSNENYYYINITEKGVIESSIKIYTTIDFSQTTNRLSGEIKTWRAEYDDSGNVTKLVNLYATENSKKTVYMTFSYEPQLYYENIKKAWQIRLGKDGTELGNKSDSTNNTAYGRLNLINNQITILTNELNDYLNSKQTIMDDFNRIMGPAIREGYWQPDDYTDYGDTHTTKLVLTGYATPVTGTSGIDSFIWDTEPFEEEQKLYYTVGVSEEKKYYPVIYLGNVTNESDSNSLLNKISSHLDELSFLFYNYNSSEARTPNERRAFTLGSQCELGFMKQTNSNTINAVLILTGAKNLSDSELEYIKNGSPQLGKLTTSVKTSGGQTYIETTEESWASIAPGENGDFVGIDTLPNCISVYPRFKVNSLEMKTSEDQLALKYNGTILEEYEDFSILTRSDTDNSYYMTLKPEVIIREGTLAGTLSAIYNISNADTAIYLDAIQVLKDSSYPQVSYDLNVALVQSDYVQKVSQMLNRIVHINDWELKFENVQGYVSEVVLNLDKPWEDKIEIKNYKTKFEDLFTKIVASTEQMKKNEYISGIVSQAFTAANQLSSETLKNSLRRVDLNYAFNNGKLTIDEVNGIWGTSDAGVVAFRGGGIFTATEKDEAGNWKWNTGIVPQGINADLITTGQLDTNRIKVYAGDQVRFQLNGDGLFAYKSFNEDINELGSAASGLPQEARNKINAQISNQDSDVDYKQYVVMNSNGLFLKVEPNGLLFDKANKNYVQYNGGSTLNRVEVSWNGFIIRNLENKEVFFADTNGNLDITGVIRASQLLRPKSGGSGNEWVAFKEVDHVNISYAVSNSSTTPPASNKWKYDISDIDATEMQNSTFLWERSITVYTDNSEDAPAYRLSNIGGSQSEGGVISTVTIEYAVSDTHNTPEDWKTTYREVAGLLTSGKFLWVRTTTIYNGSLSPTVSYTVTQWGVNGSDGSYSTEIKPVYLLTSVAENKAIPDAEVTAVWHNTYNDVSEYIDTWFVNVPGYPRDTTTRYYYYTCMQNKIYNPNTRTTTITWSPNPPRIDYGLTYSSADSTSALATATQAANDASFVANHFRNTGLSFDYRWPASGDSSKIYDLAITSASQNSGLLIGANSGITVVNSSNNGTAMTLDGSGIGMFGANISMQASASNNTSYLNLNPSKGIEMAGNTVNIEGGEINLTTGDVEPYTLTLNQDGISINAKNNSTSLIQLDRNGGELNSLVVSGVFSAPGIKPFNGSDIVNKTINSVTDFITAKTELENKSYKVITWTINANIVGGAIGNTTVQEFSNLQIDTFIIRMSSTNGVMNSFYLPPLYFNHCNTNVIVEGAKFNPGSNQDAGTIELGGSLNFINCWIDSARYAISAKWGSSAYWRNGETASSLNGKCASALMYLENGAHGYAGGTIPKCNKVFDPKNSSVYFAMDNLTQSGEDSIPTPTPATQNTITTGFELAEFNSWNSNNTTNTNWSSVSDARCGKYSGNLFKTCIKLPTIANRTSIQSASISISTTHRGSSTTGNYRIFAATSEWGSITTPSYNTSIYASFSASRDSVVNITGLANVLKQSNLKYLLIVSGSASEGEDSKQEPGLRNSANYRGFTINGMTLTYGI